LKDKPEAEQEQEMRYLTRQDAAAVMGVSLRQIDRWSAAGVLHFEGGPRSRRTTLAWIQEAMLRLGREHPAPPEGGHS
jgi:hypothetical protein